MQAMDHNPYKPPRSDVSDDPHGKAMPPTSVYVACGLVLGALAIGLLGLLPGVRPEEGDPVPAWFTLALVIIFGGVTVVLSFETLRGRNWARWTLLAYLVLGWYLTAPDLPVNFDRAPMAAVIDAVGMVMELVAAWLLFFGDGPKWFAKAGR
jgi:hypothetical protein